MKQGELIVGGIVSDPKNVISILNTKLLKLSKMPREAGLSKGGIPL
jgi:hypothetical protein